MFLNIKYLLLNIYFLISTKKNVFIYAPEFPIFKEGYFKCRILPKVLSDSTEMFRYYSCLFKISKKKETTSRCVFWKTCDIVNCFTVEASNGSFYTSNNQETVDFNANSWIDMGGHIAKGIQNYA